MVEQRTENPRVGGSSPFLGISLPLQFNLFGRITCSLHRSVYQFTVILRVLPADNPNEARTGPPQWDFGGAFLTDRAVLDAGREMLIIALKLSLPVLMFGLVAGVLVSLFQAVTQIQEFTLTFVPKLLAVILALAIFGPWMLNSLVGFFKMTFTHMPPVTN